MAILSDVSDDVTLDILARVGRLHHPKISRVNRRFRRLMASPQIRRNRLQLGTTETALYVMIGFPPYVFPTWYILDTRVIDYFRLGRVAVPPALPPGCAVVNIGSYLYVMGGYNLQRSRIQEVIRFDCLSHTFDVLPNMRRARAHAAAGVIDGKIYVIGGCRRIGNDWVEVFDFRTWAWSPVLALNDYPSLDTEFSTSVIIREKIYMLSTGGCMSYEPRQNQWIRLNHFGWGWHKSYCVVDVDDRLYSLDAQYAFEGRDPPLWVYDPEMLIPDWRRVLGVKLPSGIYYYGSKMVNLGGKLVILGVSQGLYISNYLIGLIVVALERHENGEIWGHVVSFKQVFLSSDLPAIELCRTVTV